MARKNTQQSFALMVADRPDAPATELALRLARASLAAGARIEQVFFYHDAVAVVERAQHQRDWLELAERGGFALVICGAAVERRGLELRSGGAFELGSLAQWLDACLRADRVVRFGPTDG